MEILIFSDSHGNVRAMREVFLRQLHTPDAVFFLGDGLRDLRLPELDESRLCAVAGNCDWLASHDPFAYGTERVTEVRGHRILLTHGHLYGVKSGYGALLGHAAELGVDIVLSGHTHRQYAELLPVGSRLGEVVLSRPMHLFNPGSIGEGCFGVLTFRGNCPLLSHGEL